MSDGENIAPIVHELTGATILELASATGNRGYILLLSNGKQNITMSDLMYRTDHVIQHELDIVRHQLQRNHVELILADASFENANTIRLIKMKDIRLRFQ